MMDIGLTSLVQEFVRAHPEVIVSYALVLVIVLLQDIGLPHLYGKVIQAIQKKQSLQRPFLVVLVLFMAIQVGILVCEWQEITIFPALQQFLREKVVDHLMDMHSTHFDEQKTGSILSKLIKLPTGIYGYFDQWKYCLMPQTVVCIIAVVYFMYHDVMLGTGLLCLIAAIIGITFLTPSWCSRASKARDIALNNLNEEIDDVLRNMMAVFNGNQRDEENLRFNTFDNVYADKNRSTMKCIIKFRTALTPFQIAFTSFFLYRCFVLVSSGRMSTGDFVSLFLILMHLSGAVSKMVSQLKDVVMRKGMIDGSMTVFNQDTRMPHDGSGLGKSPEAMIHFEKVTFAYQGTVKPIIQDMTLDIMRNQKVLVMGRIGRGKSTLLRLIMKYDTPQSGQLYFEGKAYADIDETYLRSKIGYVPPIPTAVQPDDLREHHVRHQWHQQGAGALAAAGPGAGAHVRLVHGRAGHGRREGWLETVRRAVSGRLDLARHAAGPRDPAAG